MRNPMDTGTSERAPDSQSGADFPSGTNGNGKAVECSGCGCTAPPSGRGQCGACGRFLPANQVALTTGTRSEQLMARLEREQAQALAVKRQDILAELGLAGGAPTVIEDLVSRYVATMAFVEHLEHRLAAVGVTSSKGRPRAALQGYLQLLDRARRLADDLAGAVQPPSTVEARRLSREARRV